MSPDEHLDAATGNEPPRVGAAIAETHEPESLPEMSTIPLNDNTDLSGPLTIDGSHGDESGNRSSSVSLGNHQQLQTKMKKLRHSGSRVRFVDPNTLYSEVKPNRQVHMAPETVEIQQQLAADVAADNHSSAVKSTPTAHSDPAKRRESISGRTLST